MRQICRVTVVRRRLRVAVTIEISNQLSEVLSMVLEHHLESTLLAVQLYGSADGWRPEAIQRY